MNIKKNSQKPKSLLKVCTNHTSVVSREKREVLPCWSVKTWNGSVSWFWGSDWIIAKTLVLNPRNRRPRWWETYKKCYSFKKTKRSFVKRSSNKYWLGTLSHISSGLSLAHEKKSFQVQIYLTHPGKLFKYLAYYWSVFCRLVHYRLFSVVGGLASPKTNSTRLCNLFTNRLSNVHMVHLKAVTGTEMHTFSIYIYLGIWSSDQVYWQI